MSWIVAGTAIGSAVLGAAQGQQKRKAEQEANQANAQITAAQTQYSPWTGMAPQKFEATPIADSALGGAVVGGYGGLAQGMKLKEGFQEQKMMDGMTPTQMMQWKMRK